MEDVVQLSFAYIDDFGYPALYLLFFLGILGMPLPEETLLVFSGFLVSTGRLGLWPTLLVSYLGSISAMTAAYWIGRMVGYPLIERYGPRFGMGYSLYKRTEEWFARAGKWALPLGYFVPGVRQFTAYFAGITRLPFPVFMLFSYAGGLVWSGVFVTLGWRLGQHWEQLFDLIAENLTVVVLALLAVLVGGSLFRRRKKTVSEQEGS